MLDLGKSAKGSPERKVLEHCTADFLVPLPEGEVCHLPELKETRELCKASSPPAAPSGCPCFPYKLGKRLKFFRVDQMSFSILRGLIRCYKWHVLGKLEVLGKVWVKT